MKRQTIVAVSVVAAFGVVSCGGNSSPTSASAYSDQLASVCRTIGRGIGNLDAATTLDQVRSNASNASALFEDGLNELKKLTIPSADKSFAADAKDMITSFEDQLDTLDAIAKSAKEGDQAAVDTKIGKLTSQLANSNHLADSLNISRCQLDPVFTTTPPTTERVVPLTLPIATLPVDTTPIETTPPDTTPIASNKRKLSSSKLVPLGSYTFADAPDGALTSFQTLLDLAPSMAAQSGTITGVDVVDSSGKSMGRVFVFQSDTDPLTPGSFDEVTPILTNNLPTSPKTIGTLTGLTFVDPSDGTNYFLYSVSNVVLWALSPSADLLLATLQAWGESIAQ